MQIRNSRLVFLECMRWTVQLFRNLGKNLVKWWKWFEKQTHNWETIDKLIIWDVIELVRSLAHCCRHQRKVLVENFEGHNSERNFQFDCQRYVDLQLSSKIDVIKLLCEFFLHVSKSQQFSKIWILNVQIYVTKHCSDLSLLE